MTNSNESAPKAEAKQTEFNSSLETLKEIRRLINQLHDARRRMDVEPYVRNRYVLNTLDCLYSESQTKFDQQELKTAKEYQEKIAILRKEHGYHIVRPERGVGGKTQANPKYLESWNIIMRYVRDYEMFLMKAMDSHGFLMTNKETEDESLDDWE